MAFVVLTSAMAGAISPEAKALFEEGRRLMAAGSTSEACARFAESFGLEASSGTLLNLALCHEKEGRTATAWTEYRAAARLARDQGRDDRATAADEKAVALEPRLSRLTATAATAPPGLQIASERGVLGEGGLGVAVPIDPGVHEVTASAPGYRAWKVALEIKEAEQRTLEVPALEEEPKPVPVLAAPERPAAPIAVVGTVAEPPPAAVSGRSSFDVIGPAAAGILIVAGTLLYGIAYARFDAAKTACNQNPGCSQSERDSRVSTIETLEYVGIGSWVAGGAVAVASGLHRWFRKHR
jgi:hypothetical protein